MVVCCGAPTSFPQPPASDPSPPLSPFPAAPQLRLWSARQTAVVLSPRLAAQNFRYPWPTSKLPGRRSSLKLPCTTPLSLSGLHPSSPPAPWFSSPAPCLFPNLAGAPPSASTDDCPKFHGAQLAPKLLSAEQFARPLAFFLAHGRAPISLLSSPRRTAQCLLGPPQRRAPGSPVCDPPRPWPRAHLTPLVCAPLARPSPARPVELPSRRAADSSARCPASSTAASQLPLSSPFPSSSPWPPLPVFSSPRPVEFTPARSRGFSCGAFLLPGLRRARQQVIHVEAAAAIPCVVLARSSLTSSICAVLVRLSVPPTSIS
jgi:hypothetical protein|uniref:Uncharacterized protein n=1 Tax=Zea mays TaxID=4577 RepID=A0A804N2T2_MAIZE|eukprot:XP_020406367.1 predicted GPI-anchored protein 58 [Zea mays]